MKIAIISDIHANLNAFKLVLSTGCRTSEILNLKWEHVDNKNKCIHLPDSKTGERNIHLPSIAFEILNSLPVEEGLISLTSYLLPNKETLGNAFSLDLASLISIMSPTATMRTPN